MPAVAVIHSDILCLWYCIFKKKQNIFGYIKWSIRELFNMRSFNTNWSWIISINALNVMSGNFSFSIDFLHRLCDTVRGLTSSINLPYLFADWSRLIVNIVNILVLASYFFFLQKLQISLPFLLWLPTHFLTPNCKVWLHCWAEPISILFTSASLWYHVREITWGGVFVW